MPARDHEDSANLSSMLPWLLSQRPQPVTTRAERHQPGWLKVKATFFQVLWGTKNDRKVRSILHTTRYTFTIFESLHSDVKSLRSVVLGAVLDNGGSDIAGESIASITTYDRASSRGKVAKF